MLTAGTTITLGVALTTEYSNAQAQQQQQIKLRHQYPMMRKDASLSK
jgi:hypothetical protein